MSDPQPAERRRGAGTTPSDSPEETDEAAAERDDRDELSDEEYAALMEEPTTGELGILADTDVPGEPG